MWAQVLLRVHYEMDDRPIGKSPTLPCLPTATCMAKEMTDIYRYPMEFTISTELTNSGGLRISGNVD